MINHFWLNQRKLKELKNLYETSMIKKEYVIHIRNVKQALNHGLVLKKVHRIIKFNQKSKIINWYEYRAKKKTKTDFEKDFFKLMNNAGFGNVRKHRDIKLVTTKARSNYLVSEPNYHTKKKKKFKKFISSRNEKNMDTDE